MLPPSRSVFVGPRTGRYVESGAIGLARDVNTYTYLNCHPTGSIDTI